MYDVEAALRPGVRQNELSAIFLRNVFEHGASSSIIDPIWNITPLSVAAGTRTANDDVGFPLASNDRFLREGELILCDTGITWMGYHSDFGKTWICSVDPRPTAEQRACYTRWCEVIDAVYATIKPGATCGDLVRAAASVEPKHALRHFYLGHGCGCDSGEAPFIGSDLGIAVRRHRRARTGDGVRARAGRVARRHRRLPQRGDRRRHRRRLREADHLRLHAVRVTGRGANPMTDLLATPNIGTGVARAPRPRRLHRAARRPPRARARRRWPSATSTPASSAARRTPATPRASGGCGPRSRARSCRRASSCARPAEVELLSFSASYEDIPDEVGPDHFFPVTWNPMNMMDRFQKTEGVLDARRIGFDGLSPFFEGMLRQTLPEAEFVGVEDMMRELRRA